MGEPPAEGQIGQTTAAQEMNAPGGTNRLK